MHVCLLALHLLAAPPSIADINGLSAARITDLTRYDAGLSSTDVQIVVATVHAIGRLQHLPAQSRLQAALNHADPGVRRAAVFAWGQTDLPAGPVVERLKADVAPAVRQAAVKALGKLTAADWGVLLAAAGDDADPVVRAEARIALALHARRNDGAGHGMTAALPGWLSAPQPALRRAAAYAFMRAKKLDGPTNFETALQCAGDTDAGVQALCVRVLGRFKDLEPHQTKALDTALRSAVAHADWRVGVAAWRAAKGAQRLFALLPALARLPADVKADPAILAGPKLHVWIAGLDALLTAPARPTQVMQIAKTLKTLNVRDDAGVALGRAHVRCRALALLGDPKTLLTCDPAAPPGLAAALMVPLIKQLTPTKRVTAIVLHPPSTTAMRVALLEAAASLKDASLSPEHQAQLASWVTKSVGNADMAIFSQAASSAVTLGVQKAAPGILLRLPHWLKQTEYEAAIAAIDALASLKYTPAKPALRALLRAPNHAVATAAAKALTALGEPATAQPTPGTPQAVKRPAAKTAYLKTTKGEIIIDLYNHDAPLTVANFVRLAEKGFYDNLLFHRVVADFVVQGGDPRGDGWGGPGYAIVCEINPQRYRRGAVGMALAGKDTGGSQWFITHSPQPHLDGRYTVFGQVRAFDVVDALTVGDRILGVRIER